MGLWAVGSVLHVIPRTSLVSHKAAGAVGSSMEPRWQGAVWSYWASLKEY